MYSFKTVARAHPNYFFNSFVPHLSGELMAPFRHTAIRTQANSQKLRPPRKRVDCSLLAADAKGPYTAFYKQTCPQKREIEGLQAAFDTAFHVSHTCLSDEFIEYNLAKPAFDVRECQTRG